MEVICPQLPYPDGYCHDCSRHIRENDLFGFINNQLYCATCYTSESKRLADEWWETNKDWLHCII